MNQSNDFFSLISDIILLQYTAANATICCPPSFIPHPGATNCYSYIAINTELFQLCETTNQGPACGSVANQRLFYRDRDVEVQPIKDTVIHRCCVCQKIFFLLIEKDISVLNGLDIF